MRIRDVYTPNARTAFRDQPLAEAARTMCSERIGALVVVDRQDPSRRPIGILTDRDIVRGQLRLGADLYCLTVGDVMTSDPLVLPLHLEVAEAVEALNARAVRRAPVLDSEGNLAGMVSLDDLLPAIALELDALASLMGTQAHHARARPT
jgi:CBS domain-containing protein